MCIFPARLPTGSKVVPSGRWLGDQSEGGGAHGPHSARGRIHRLAALGAASRCGRIKNLAPDRPAGPQAPQVVGRGPADLSSKSTPAVPWGAVSGALGQAPGR